MVSVMKVDVKINNQGISTKSKTEDRNQPHRLSRTNQLTKSEYIKLIHRHITICLFQSNPYIASPIYAMFNESKPA